MKDFGGDITDIREVPREEEEDNEYDAEEEAEEEGEEEQEEGEEEKSELAESEFAKTMNSDKTEQE